MTTSPGSGIQERKVAVNDVSLHLLEAGSFADPLVVLAHGFPELAYSWRHQLPELAEAGYHVVAPDQRGYGRSSRPDGVDEYDILHLTGDLTGLLDDLGAEQAAFVGHDWGAIVVWQQALLDTGRVRGVVGMSVPFLPRGPIPPITMLRQVMGDSFFYILYFQEPGTADAELARDPATTFRRLLGGLAPGGDADAANAAAMFAPGTAGFVDRLSEPAALPSWLSQEELDTYVGEFSATGFTGGVNWYRNLDRNWELTPQLDGASVTVPSLFIGGAHDPVLVMTPPAVGHAYLADHRGDVIIDGAGHWVQQERPSEVNEALVSFLDDIHGRTT